MNLALLTGQIGKEGAGIFALTEHNNLQGVCDMGMLPDRLPGYREVAERRRARGGGEALGSEAAGEAGAGLALAAARIAVTGRCGRSGSAATTRSAPRSLATRPTRLQQCELVVAQHLFLTESARYAHVVLPTTAFGEERVTFTNTERRIQLAEQVIEPLPGTTPAWQQLTEVAQAHGRRLEV